MAEWLLKRTDADIKLMSKVLGVSENLALILAHRGIRSKNAAVKFLRPEMKFLSDIHKMKDLDRACALIAESIAAGEKIFVYGDYDADGVMSTVILMKTLIAFGADVRFYIPHREEEGYGLNAGAVRRMHADGGRLIITCDNGIAALSEISEAETLGMKVVVIDHHEPGFIIGENGEKTDLIPEADCVVDPKRLDCPYPFKQYCAAGLCFRFAEAFYDAAGKSFDCRDECLTLAAFATICDMVPLMEENRIVVRAGLDILKRNRKANLGLWHLMRAKAVHEKVIGVFDIGFLLGPCVNASGRLADAASAVRLFLTENPEEAAELARELAELNERRKEMTAQAVERAMAELPEHAPDKVLVLYNEEIHESIAGIVAGRIKESINRPVIMLTRSDNYVKGSARSIEGYNIFEALYESRELFVRFGGHAMAAGLTMPPEHIDLLHSRLNESCSLTEKDFAPVLYVDRGIQPEYATYELTRELDLLAPFGRDNPEPLFGAKRLKPEQLRMIDEKNTMIFTFGVNDTYRKIRGVCFGLNNVFKEQINEMFDEYDSAKIFAGFSRSADFIMDVVYALEINEYNNNISVQMRIKDFHIYRGQE
ncbi:MAG: single-stranded-DNA-specific exonuclease RecJ [Clostridiales bacterium]|jgi:single-stranded-DNA-specific exonuclease|nr:single-stranded-DNA-specific exonuclease RecJ [Clostridiales bacterium]